MDARVVPQFDRIFLGANRRLFGPLTVSRFLTEFGIAGGIQMTYAGLPSRACPRPLSRLSCCSMSAEFDEIVPSLSAAELEQVIVLVGRSPRVYPPGTLDALKQRRALVSPVPPQRSGESTRSDVAAGKQHARTPGADLRGQPETRTSARSDAGTDDRRSVIQVGSPQNAERHQTGSWMPSQSTRSPWLQTLAIHGVQ